MSISVRSCQDILFGGILFKVNSEQIQQTSPNGNTSVIHHQKIKRYIVFGCCDSYSFLQAGIDPVNPWHWGAFTFCFSTANTATLCSKTDGAAWDCSCTLAQTVSESLHTARNVAVSWCFLFCFFYISPSTHQAKRALCRLNSTQGFSNITPISQRWLRNVPAGTYFSMFLKQSSAKLW